MLILTGNACVAQLPDFPQGPPYGKHCGIVGIDPEPRVTTEQMIQFQDTAAIFNWLHDADAVYQTYAAEALIRLQKAGMLISKKELVIVGNLKLSKRMVHTCSGCTHFEMPIKDALEMFLD